MTPLDRRPPRPLRPRAAPAASGHSSTPVGRRTLLGAGGALGLGALLAACSTGPSGSSASSAASDGGGNGATYPRTVTHVYGTTTIPAQPTRVATISWVNPDTVLALGVVPIGMDAVTWGGNAQQRTDWIDARIAELGGQMPTLYAATDGIDTDGIAASTPDLIVAAYSGLTSEQYETLSKIAPTIAYPEHTPAWGTSWQDSLTLTGAALGKEAEAASVIESVEGAIGDFAAQHASLAGTTFLYGTIDPAAADQISLYTDVDNRPRFLEELGMSNAPIVTANQNETDFFLTWPPERADELESDILISWFNDDAAVQAVQADPLLSRIPAIQRGTFVAQSDQQQALALSAASALSLPWALTHVMDPIVHAADQAQGR